MAIVVSSLNLKARGKRLFAEMRDKYPDMDPIQLELLVEACRIADQLEEYHDLLRGDKAAWAFVKMPRNQGNLVLEIDNVATQSRQLQLALKAITTSLTVAGVGAGSGEGDDVADEIGKRRQARLDAKLERAAARSAGTEGPVST